MQYFNLLQGADADEHNAYQVRPRSAFSFAKHQQEYLASSQTHLPLPTLSSLPSPAFETSIRAALPLSLRANECVFFEFKDPTVTSQPRSSNSGDNGTSAPTPSSAAPAPGGGGGGGTVFAMPPPGAENTAAIPMPPPRKSADEKTALQDGNAEKPNYTEGIKALDVMCKLLIIFFFSFQAPGLRREDFRPVVISCAWFEGGISEDSLRITGTDSKLIPTKHNSKKLLRTSRIHTCK